MIKEDITYSDAIEKVMLKNGYFAPLKLIYREIWDYKDLSKIKGKTPNFTIQERVQRDPRFVRIGLGIYALKKYLGKLPKEIEKPKNLFQEKERNHARIEGMLLEIGNNKEEVGDTYTNDKKWIFQNKPLHNLSTLKTIPPFTYNKIIEETVRFFDVIWFNKRGFPLNIFEVEESTDFRDAFIKFIELQDFNAKFFCVSDESRKNKFEKEINKIAFQPIKKKCEFINYSQIENDYSLLLKKSYL